jgi:thymidylate kinase
MQLTSNTNLTARFLTLFFNRLNEEKLTYCVLRNYETLPERVGNDVDIWIKDEHRAKLYTIIKDLANTFGYILDYIPRLTLTGEGNYFLIKEQEGKINVIHLDCWLYIHWKGICYIDEKVIENNLQLYKGLFYIPSPGIIAAIVMIKGLLYHNKIKEKYKALIQEYSKNNSKPFIDSISKSFGTKTAASICNMAINSKWRLLEKKTFFFQLVLLLRTALHPLRQVRNWVCYLLAQFERYFLGSRGIFLVLIGPDGSGKSTTAKNLIESEVGKLFQKRYYFHGHFLLLPELKQVVGLLRNKKEKRQIVKNDNFSKPFGMLRSMIYPFYYGLNYFLRHFFIWKEKARGNLIVFDRYFYDYFIQRQYTNCPRWLLNVVSAIIPSPDIIIYLRNRSEVVFKRKPELTTKEIKRQLEICDGLTKRLKNSYIIETNSEKSVLLQMQKIIVNKVIKDKGNKR